ncbi:MAG: hypothetical protein DME16_06825 [Candidatus Rokuibacteriota bacterium]|nr:MAG: hypothetical protein DME16_06825 [Candidatus Rokubacteria bacterium]
MHFEFSPAERAFAEEVRSFLRAHPPATFPIDGMDAGYGSGAHSRPFLRALADQGWLSLTWPRAFGGQERPLTHKLLLFEELAAAAAPFGPLAGCDQTAEGIIRYGSEHLRREVLPRIARGEATFWQGFSEPNSGSDLASVDNATPGMDIRPIRSLTGEVYHYEVFLDEVRVPAECLLGKEGEGFTQLLRGLDTDRFWGRFYKAPMLRRVLDELVRHANETTRNGVPLARDSAIRRRLASLATEIEAVRLLFYRIGWMLQEGLPTPYETALCKVMADELGQAVAAFGMEMLGLYAPLTQDSRSAKLRGSIQHLYQTSMGQTIAGGTSEVLRSTVATRGLGLPSEPRVRD